MRFFIKCLGLSVITLALTFMVDRLLNLEIFKLLFPETVALKDFEYSDLFFVTRPDPEIDTNIVIVNIGMLGRGEIADQINQINRHKPKVLGFDVVFDSPKIDSTATEKLAQAINKTEKIVLAISLLRTDSLARKIFFNEIAYDSILQLNPLLKGKAKEGYVNLYSIEFGDYFLGGESVKAVRSFVPQFKINNKWEQALAVKIAMQFDSSKASEFLKRNNEIEFINFRRNTSFLYLLIHPSRYKVIDWSESLDSVAMDSLSKFISNKIVLFGYHGNHINDMSFGDMFFTPLNSVPLGKSLPDMYGVVIQANIISEILNEDYIDATSNFQEYLFAFIACILHIALLLLLQKKFPIWYDIFALLLIIVQLFLLALIRLTLFHFNIKAELTVTLGTMAIAGFVVSQYPHFAKKEYWGRLVRKVRPGQTTLDTSNFSK